MADQPLLDFVVRGWMQRRHEDHVELTCFCRRCEQAVVHTGSRGGAFATLTAWIGEHYTDCKGIK